MKAWTNERGGALVIPIPKVSDNLLISVTLNTVKQLVVEQSDEEEFDEQIEYSAENINAYLFDQECGDR